VFRIPHPGRETIRQSFAGLIGRRWLFFQFLHCFRWNELVPERGWTRGKFYQQSNKACFNNPFGA